MYLIKSNRVNQDFAARNGNPTVEFTNGSNINETRDAADARGCLDKGFLLMEKCILAIRNVISYREHGRVTEEPNCEWGKIARR
jgi:hypothetical protein